MDTDIKILTSTKKIIIIFMFCWMENQWLMLSDLFKYIFLNKH